MRPTIIFILLASTSFPSPVTLSLPHSVFVGVYYKRKLVVSRQDLCQSYVVVHRVAGQAEQAGPQPITALIQGLQQERGKDQMLSYTIFFIKHVGYI